MPTDKEAKMPTYTHTPKIAALPRKNIGEDQEVITEIHVAITTTDGTTDATLQSFAYAIPEADLTGPYVPIADLDAATILGWIPAETMAEWEAAMENHVAGLAAAAAAERRADVPAHLAG
jgi:hypothetical protein